MAYATGDRLEVVEQFVQSGQLIKVGWRGTVRWMYGTDHVDDDHTVSHWQYAIEWDEPYFPMHSCSGYTKSLRGYWCDQIYISLRTRHIVETPDWIL